MDRSDSEGSERVWGRGGGDRRWVGLEHSGNVMHVIMRRRV